MALGFRKHRGGEMVRFGFYWNIAEWEAQIVPAEGGQLKGNDAVKYVRMPLMALLIVAPLMGAAYAMFLPFIGFAMIVMALAGKLRAPVRTSPPAADASGDAVAAETAKRKSEETTHKRAA